LYHSIRFAPPLVIEEEDLLKAIKLIEESLVEIDTVSLRYAAIKPSSSSNMLMRCRLAPQLDKIPGDDSEEKNTVIGLED
jgi:ornithine--oxo-acid transaminase